jgi:hypothetical protein
MDINMYEKIHLGVTFAGGVVKLLVGLILFAIVFYSLMFILKFRVLQDTVEITASPIAKLVIKVNLVISFIGAVLAFILILL